MSSTDTVLPAATVGYEHNRGKPTNALAIRVHGQVQGVGFRPFIWQLAQHCQAKGEVINDHLGVLITLLQPIDSDAFIKKLWAQLPPLARIDKLTTYDARLYPAPDDFTIGRSQHGQGNTRIAPDVATCADCLAEMNNPQDRRYRYPFINCTHCGPRISIIKQVPYDRPYTSMAEFPLCADCQQEYDNPADRRFHAQPIACPVCGPKLSWRLVDGAERAAHDDALNCAITALQQGQIVAIKALGGYHLAVDASNEHAVQRLRQRKQRPSKPLAVMVADLAMAQQLTTINHAEQQQLQSHAAPIVLLVAKTNNGLAAGIAPNMRELGIMLPSNPLQHLLLQEFKRPLVMTSANASGLPPCIDDEQALRELSTIADGWLSHNRPIVNRVDDSLVRVSRDVSQSGVPQVLRRARGLVPTPLSLPAGFEKATGVLSYGSDLKNTFAFLRQGQAILSTHLGDLAVPSLYDSYQTLLREFPTRFDFQVTLRVCDSHPAYLSSQLARQHSSESNGELIQVDHHHAHVAACLADNNHGLADGEVLALVLDGLGWGGEGTSHQLWGGEILKADYQHCQHIEGLPALPLIGGDLAAKTPWRNLLAHLEFAAPQWQRLELVPLQHLKRQPLALLRQAIAKGINCPLASSSGRWFDAVAALLLDFNEAQSFEGEAAMQLESLAWQAVKPSPLPQLQPSNQHLLISQVLPRIWQGLLQGLSDGESAAKLALQFHIEFAQLWLDRLYYHCQQQQIYKIVLSGGVMQNQLLQQLLQPALQKLSINEQPLTVLAHQQIPANDGGLALGQALIGWARWQQAKSVRGKA